MRGFLDELGYLPFSQAGSVLLFHLLSRLYEHTSVIIIKAREQSRKGDKSTALQESI